MCLQGHAIKVASSQLMDVGHIYKLDGWMVGHGHVDGTVGWEIWLLVGTAEPPPLCCCSVRVCVRACETGHPQISADSCHWGSPEPLCVCVCVCGTKGNVTHNGAQWHTHNHILIYDKETVRAGHFRYFFVFSIIKNDCFALFIKLMTYFCTSPI